LFTLFNGLPFDGFGFGDIGGSDPRLFPLFFSRDLKFDFNDVCSGVFGFE